MKAVVYVEGRKDKRRLRIGYAKLRLHIGCGRQRFPQSQGWVNIDISPKVRPDKVASVERLPFRTGSVDEVYTAHTIEHAKNFVKAMKEIHRVLKKGAKATVIVPHASVVTAFKPWHITYFTFDAFTPFKKGNYEDWYLDFHFSQVRVRMKFSYYNKLIEWFANKFPFFYESTFLSHLFPCNELHVVLIK